MTIRKVIGVCALLCWACSVSAATEYLNSEQSLGLNLPFSEAVRVGDIMFLSGQLGTLPGTTDIAPGGIQGQAHQALKNIKAILERNGSSMDKVVKCTVMMADIAEWPAFNEVYVTYFPGPKPARSAFAAGGLAFGAKVELECWAGP
jgi:2-iminobutanoate/2-iminopropanoate deaminase